MVTPQLTELPVPRAALGEGPCWEPAEGALYWTDIPACRVHRLAADGTHTSWDAGRPVGAVVPRAGGGLALAAKDGFWALDPATGRLALLAHVEADLPDNRMNDGACDGAGRFFAGTMAEDESPGAGTLYRLDPGLAVTPVLGGVSVSNGSGWSLDGSRMYYVDSLAYSVDVFDYDADSGAIGNRRVLARIGDGEVMPDGLAVDSGGDIWVAVWGGSAVLRYGPDGRLKQSLEIPAAHVTSCAFGGPGLATLYITTAGGPGPGAGALFACQPGAAGLLANPFRG
jgi:sugar lactone lactonase YvrE